MKEEDKEKVKAGSVVQVNPKIYPEIAGSLLVVKEVSERGVQGYLLSPFEMKHLVRFQGIAYLRPKWEEVEYVGHIKWYLKVKKAEEPAVAGPSSFLPL